MSEPVLYEGGGFVVTRSFIKTPRKTYAVKRIEYVSVRRTPLLLAAIPAIGFLGFAIGFWRYLYAGELLVLIGGSLTALSVAWQVGTLRVHSLALKDGELATSLARIGRLKAVRDAVETAMGLHEQEDRE